MKKTILMVLVIAFMAIGVQSLQAQEVEWYVGSDVNSCSTYFFVGLHANTVVITRTRVSNTLEVLIPEADYITFTRTQHYQLSSPCPNWRYIYRIYNDVNGVRTLATNQAYIVRAQDNNTNIYCMDCMEQEDEDKTIER